MKKILVLGASGYIGSQLVERLLAQGLSVRAAGRSEAKLKQMPWANHPLVDIVSVDVMNINSLKQAWSGCGAVYYLVHSMNSENKDFSNADRQAAQNVSRAAQESGVERIIYLGGLGADRKTLSKHLLSRMEVSDILHAGKTPVTTLRAAMIIGKGSVSFEILRRLVDRLPIMITPRWVNTESQPIAVENVLNYLVGCLNNPQTMGKVFDIGGADVVSYREIMDIYSQEAGFNKRLIIPVPVLTPGLSSHWIQFVTGFPAYIGRPLAEGLKNRVVCQEDSIKALIPQRILSCREAIRAALEKK